MTWFDRLGWGRRPRQQLILGAGAIFVALWLAWSIIANTAADSLARSDAAAALAWRSESPNALVRLASERLTAADPAAEAGTVRNLAERALRAAPLQERALALLGLVAELDGDRERAGRLMELAAERSRRDGLVEIWSFFRRTQLGDFATAFGHADALLRSRPSLRDEIAPTLIAFAIDPDAKPALVRALASNPPWRGWYLGELAKQSNDPGIAYAIYSDLKQTASPPTDAELLPYLRGLINAGEFEQAYLTWINFLPKARRSSISYAYNGDFEYPSSGLPFDWMISAITGASTEIVGPGANQTGYAIRVEFANRRVPYRHLRKLMMLPPGSYRLTGQARAQRLENDRGLAWQVACAEADGEVLGASKPVKGTIDWHEFSLLFSVPQTACRAQWLTLTLPARTTLEQKIGGVAWFDDIRVSRVEPGQNALSARE